MRYHFINHPIIIILIFLLTIGACSTEVNINAEWEDRTIVYCFLNQKDTAHYVRIQHAFIGEGNNVNSLSEPDSIYYKEDLEVKLERRKDNHVLEIIDLEKTDDISKANGYFTTENHVLYKTNKTIYPDSKYKLNIFIPSLKKTISATTYLIYDFSLDAKSIMFYTSPMNFSTNHTFPCGWISPKNGKIFQPILIFNYTESISYLETKKSILWHLPKKVAINSYGNEKVYLEIYKSDFLKFIGATLSEIAYDDFRASGNIDLKIEVSTDELYSYYQLNNVGIGLSQGILNFTNIENGYGIFTAKNHITFQGSILDGRTQDSLSCSQYTKHLNFVDRWGNLHNCD